LHEPAIEDSDSLTDDTNGAAAFGNCCDGQEVFEIGDGVIARKCGYQPFHRIDITAANASDTERVLQRVTSESIQTDLPIQNVDKLDESEKSIECVAKLLVCLEGVIIVRISLRMGNWNTRRARRISNQVRISIQKQHPKSSFQKVSPFPRGEVQGGKGDNEKAPWSHHRLAHD
jgi:secreted PhoX family phosphatase